MKYFYPAIFHPEESGYSVSIPGLEGCFTQGETMEECLNMAQEAIGLYLEGETVPEPMAPEKVPVPEGDFLMMVTYDSLEYAKKHNHKSVKKTLSIPGWLNEVAEASHINFSHVLQEALKKQLGI
jgi:predicted RNase H-like HicB family nuclease